MTGPASRRCNSVGRCFVPGLTRAPPFHHWAELITIARLLRGRQSCRSEICRPRDVVLVLGAAHNGGVLRSSGSQATIRIAPLVHDRWAPRTLFEPLRFSRYASG